ncbi:MAG TPA: hypothetical protein PKD55_22425, partial [Bellilinea sp.]|nr:hypothetical protein [Bellilinea sp.]
MYKHKALIVLTGFLFLLVVCIFISLSITQTPLNTPCSPIVYPEGNKAEWTPSEVYTFETSTHYENVVDFYRSHLRFDPPFKTKYEVVEWVEHSIQKKGVLFECGSKLNNYEVELGCIFIHKTQGNVAIDIMWSYGEGAPTPCYVLPEVEPEDYLVSP